MKMRKTLSHALLAGLVLVGGSVTSWADGTWRENAPMASARAHLGATAIGDEIYVAGGAGIAGPRSSFDAYDPIGDFWRPLPPMPMGREQFGITSAQGNIFVSGGLAGNDRSAVLSRELWLYDTGERLWVRKANMPHARRGHVMLTTGSKLYVIGGAGESPSKVMAYDLGNDKWSTLPGGLAVPRSGLAGVVDGGNLIVLGGIDMNGTPVARVDKLDTNAGNWSRLKDMPIARSGHVASLMNGRLHVAGGTTLVPSRTYQEHHSFDLSAQKWREEPQLLTPRHSMASATTDGSWHLIGGGSGSGFFTLFTVADAVETFIPSN